MAEVKKTFKELLEERKQAGTPAIVNPKEIDLTTLPTSAIVLESNQIQLQRPNYRVLYCLESNGKRFWKLILNEGSKE